MERIPPETLLSVPPTAQTRAHSISRRSSSDSTASGSTALTSLSTYADPSDGPPKPPTATRSSPDCVSDSGTGHPSPPLDTPSSAPSEPAYNFPSATQVQEDAGRLNSESGSTLLPNPSDKAKPKECCRSCGNILPDVPHPCLHCFDSPVCSSCVRSPGWEPPGLHFASNSTSKSSGPSMKVGTPTIVSTESDGPEIIECKVKTSADFDEDYFNTIARKAEEKFKEMIADSGVAELQAAVKSSLMKDDEPEPDPEEASSAIPEQPILQNPFPEEENRVSRISAAEQWAARKKAGEENAVIDELLQYVGLEEVKIGFLEMLSRVNLHKKQGFPICSLKDRLNVVFEGNPGTGKTTIARLYAKFLHSIGLLQSPKVKETSGMKVAVYGAREMGQEINKLLDGGGGVLFVDEAYQLTSQYSGNSSSSVGRKALDIILTSMENNIGKLAVVLVGYKDQMEPLFGHNVGLAGRIPSKLNFPDFSDAQLWQILYNNIHKRYRGKMKVEGGMSGLYMRIAIRRLAKGRSRRGFDNARAVENLLLRISYRQSLRVATQQGLGGNPDQLFFTKEDLIGPDPSNFVFSSPAWVRLQELVGLEDVKNSVSDLITLVQASYNRELNDKEPFEFSLNQLFVGPTGTGKSTVAELYGQILVDLGLLSRGEFVRKTPADFIGYHLGHSEFNTRQILESTAGKVLFIDEAYVLDPCDTQRDEKHNLYKVGVIDTIVSLIQGTANEDRCIILAGYEDKIRDMFEHANPGLSRRFPLAQPFRFQNFTLPELEDILKFKMKERSLSCSKEALEVARGIFEREMMRHNFTNAGVVEDCLRIAQVNYGRRQIGSPAGGVQLGGELEAEDFDSDYRRSPENTIAELRHALQGRVKDTVIENLCSYPQLYDAVKNDDLNPRELLPTNFLFVGAPGTGKTITAQQMGKLFFGMGFLSSPEVVKCTASDLLGKAVGHTVPKTRRQLERGLGKILFIDEAYNLFCGGFAADAVGEIVQFLNQPAHIGRMVVILAGYKEDMQALMYLQPDLSGLFSEEVVFESLTPAECITLLDKELRRSRLKIESDFLSNDKSAGYTDVSRLFKALRIFPDWTNARDVKFLAKRIVGAFLKSQYDQGQQVQQCRTVSSKLVVQCMWDDILKRRARFANQEEKAEDEYATVKIKVGDREQAFAIPR